MLVKCPKCGVNTRAGSKCRKCSYGPITAEPEVKDIPIDPSDRDSITRTVDAEDEHLLIVDNEDLNNVIDEENSVVE